MKTEKSRSSEIKRSDHSVLNSEGKDRMSVLKVNAPGIVKTSGK